MKDEEILGLARGLREVLPDLNLETDHRDDLMNAIAAGERGELAPIDLLRHLAGHPDARRWLQEQMPKVGRTLSFTKAKPLFTPFAGDGSAVSSQEFVCPEPGCTTNWFRQRVGQQPPLCETHHKRLVPKP